MDDSVRRWCVLIVEQLEEYLDGDEHALSS